MSRRTISLQIRLALIIGSIMLPALVLILHDAHTERRRTREIISKESLHLCRLAAGEINQLVEGAYHLLHTVASLDDPARPTTAAELSALIADLPAYANLGLADAQGMIYCSAAPMDRPVNISDRTYFQRTLTNHAFSIGNLMVGRVTGKPTLNFGYPLRAADGETIRGIAYCALDEGLFRRLAARMMQDHIQGILPAGSMIMITDGRGTILARQPDEELWQGKLMPDSPLIKLLREQPEGVATLAGMEQQERLYAFTRCMEQASDLSVCIGIPSSAIKHQIDRQLWLRLGILACATLLSLLLAHQLNSHFVLRHMRELMKTVKRLGEGDLNARTGMPRSDDEFGQLAHTLDQVAGALQEKIHSLHAAEDHLRRTNTALKTISDCNQALLRSESEHELVSRVCQTIVNVGKFPAALVLVNAAAGHAAPQVIGAGGVPDNLINLLEKSCRTGPDGILGQVLRDCTSVILSCLESVQPREPWIDRVLQDGFQSCAIVPILSNTEPIGTLLILSRDQQLSFRDDMQILRELAGDMAYGIHNLRIRQARNKSESALQLSETRYQALLQHLPSGIFEASPAGLYDFVNDRWRELTGLSLEQARGQGWSSSIHVLDRSRVMAAWKDYISQGTAFSIEYRIQHAKGAVYTVHATATPWRDQAGAVTGHLGSVQDITAIKQAEAQLMQSQRLESVGKLAGGIAHDFNNLLQAILGYSELLLDDINEKDPRRADVMEIHKTAQRAASLTRQLLAFSRKQPLSLRHVNLSELVAQAHRMLERILGEDVKIVLRLAKDLEPVMADAGQIEQVLVNLAANARDAMPGGGVLTITTDLAELAEEAAPPEGSERRAGRFCRITLEDSGSGMDDKTLQHIFEPFFTTKPAGQGTGLGLAMVHGIVKQHNGWIEVHSTSGAGTRFEIFVPPAESPETRSTARPDASLPGLQGHGECLLVVEDESSAASPTLRVLASHNYRALAARSLAEARKLLLTQPGGFALVFSDVILPDGNGLDLVEEFRQMRPGIKVILTSGYTGDKSKWSEIQARGYPFLPKPFSLDQLLQLIARVLRQP